MGGIENDGADEAYREARGWLAVGGGAVSETDCTACVTTQEHGGDMCRDHAEEAVLDQIAAEAEARGYARGKAESGNYVADKESEPRRVVFANGRVVWVSSHGAYLCVGWSKPKGEK